MAGMAGASGSAGMAGAAGAGGAPPVQFTVNASVVLSKNYENQYDALFRATFGAGSKSSRGKLMARFCTDAACDNVVALLAATVQGADSNGYYVYSTGFPKDVSVSGMVSPDAKYVQFVLDTQYSIDVGKGACDTADLQSCPGDADTLQTDADTIQNTGAGAPDNPAPGSSSVTITDGGTADLTGGTTYLGSIRYLGQEIWTPPTKETGKVLVSTSNNGYTDKIQIADLSTYKISSDSYVMQRDGADYKGDICGLIQGAGAVYAVGVTPDFGAHVFQIDPTTGKQVGTDSVAFIPHPDFTGPESSGPQTGLAANRYPYPCRGVFVNAADGSKHLYLVQFKGAGSLTTSHPAPLYHVALGSSPTSERLFASNSDMAWRAIDISGNTLYIAEMSWSVSNQNDVGKDKICTVHLGNDGSASSKVNCTATTYVSDNSCGSTAHWPSALKVVSLAGTPYVAMGHDGGVAVFDTSVSPQYNVDLTHYGTLIGDMAMAPDGSRLYASPQCKADTAVAWFELPYAKSTEKSDKNLVAVLDTSGSKLKVATTSIDIDGDSTPDNGVDLDYYFLKKYIRSFGTTLPIPPVVYTGPQLAVGKKSLFVRGTGIQGSGGTLSSSGMGQVQDMGVFDLGTGKGIVFQNYMPFFDGLSSNAGAGPGIWGYELGAEGEENSTGAILYLP